MGSSSKNTNTQTAQGPWAPAQGSLESMIPQITGMEGTMANWTPYGSYSGPAVAGFTNPQTSAFGDITGLVNDGGSAVAPANANLNSTLNGDFLSAGNPYFQNMVTNIDNTVLPTLDSQWSKAGRFAGNEEAPQAIATGLGNAVGNLAYQNYGAERQNMMTGDTQAPALDQAQYIDPSMLLQMGGQQQQQNQQLINSLIYQGQYGQQQPENALATTLSQLMNVGNMGKEGSTNTTETASPSALQMLTGGGLSLGGLLGSGGSGGIGAGLSGIGSGLGSLFSGAGAGLGSMFSGAGSGLASLLSFSLL